MNLVVLLLIILIVVAILGAPGVAIQHDYGWYPSGGLGLVVVILIILLLVGRI